MSNLIRLLAESAAALDRAGMFKEADLVDDMLRSLAADAAAAPKTARALLADMTRLVDTLKAADVGASVAIKAVKDLLAQLDAAVVASFQTKKGDSRVRIMAKDALNRFLAIANSNNDAANEMFRPIVKPMVDALQMMLRLPDNLIWS
jgi:hypothetical protein